MLGLSWGEFIRCEFFEWELTRLEINLDGNSTEEVSGGEIFLVPC